MSAEVFEFKNVAKERADRPAKLRRLSAPLDAETVLNTPDLLAYGYRTDSRGYGYGCLPLVEWN
jgi:hypothetical protein